MKFRPMKKEEHPYCFAQSHQISMQTGLIGHLRADFGSLDGVFFSTFFDFRADLKTDDFKAEFDTVINALRKDPDYGCILKDRKAIRAYCNKYPESELEDGRAYGFRADTDHYSYMIRVIPYKGEYNLYCYCYVRQWLDRHMERAANGIRFITPNYKEKFRIADGDSIRIINRDGEKLKMTCRYIDDCHVETGGHMGNLWHICEFAERMEENGCQGIIPLRKSLPEKCFSFKEDTGKVVVIQKGEVGYTPADAYGKNMTPSEAADKLNETLGVSKFQEMAMVAGATLGWDAPEADPAYHEKRNRIFGEKEG